MNSGAFEPNIFCVDVFHLRKKNHYLTNMKFPESLLNEKFYNFAGFFEILFDGSNPVYKVWK